ncbi:MAG TPA: PRC-barrel domain-containing protein [Candidatus Limnocylindria bacterium]|nr:PRC-barrel domain-containing protein [Candidatus Limnocylindria bacterium]
MRIDLGAKVRTKDGHEAGHIKQAIFDPRTNEITSYVVNTGGLLGHDVIVSNEMIESATSGGGEILINIDKADLDDLSRYEASEYTTPPAGWLAPAVYGFPVGGYLWPVTDSEIPRTVESPAPEEELGRGPHISKGAKVRSATGDVIGEVEVVRVDDETGELRGIVVKRGDELVEVEAEHIGRVDGDIHLASEEREIRGRETA